MDNGNTWRKYLTDYNEGLGLVYERFVLNDFLDNLRKRYNLQSVLEAPLYGMAGVSGINDVIFAQNGANVTLVDDNAERIRHLLQQKSLAGIKLGRDWWTMVEAVEAYIKLERRPGPKAD